MSFWLLLACGRDPSLEWTPVRAAPEWPDEAGAPIPFARDPDWLADVSRYGFRGQITGRSRAGSFGVANGEVFGLIGLDTPINTLTNSIGPGYQVEAGFFGDSGIELTRDGEPLPVDESVAQRPRRSLVVRTESRSGDLSLVTTDLAVPDQPVIARRVTVVNTGEETRVSLEVSLARGAEEPGEVSGDSLVQQRGRRRLWVSCEGAAPDVEGKGLTRELLLAADSEETVLCTYRYGEDDDPGQSGTFADWLDLSQQRSVGWLERAATLRLADAKVNDLYEGMLLTLYAQTAENGLVSPMSRYTWGWLRDSEGPVRLYLQAGLLEDAAKILDTTYLIALDGARIGNSFSLDSSTGGDPPADPETFWYEAEFMPGREPVEAPSYPVILHATYADFAGTPAWDPSRRAFLRACVERQEVEAGLLRFSGDETWRYPMGLRLGQMPEDLGWSAASALLYLGAAESLRALGEPAPETLSVEEALADFEVAGFTSPVLTWEGEPVPTPYEDVSALAWWLTPWVVPEFADRAATLAALEAVFDAGATEPLFGFTGLAPGLMLQLAQEDAAARGRWFQALDTIATPSGHFEELHQLEGVLSLAHAPDGLGADASARFRPWEGGDTVTALLTSLFGYAPRAGRLVLAPRLPPGVPYAEIRGLAHGANRIRVWVAAYAEGQVVEVEAAAEAELDLWLPEGELRLSFGGEPASKEREGAWLRGLSVGPGRELRAVVTHP